MIYRKIKQHFLRTMWNIGFIEDDLETILDPSKPLNIHWMKHSISNSWFADPFILDVTDTHIEVLVEEFYYPINLGRITKLTLTRKDFALVKRDIVLELDTHLSFPIIKRVNGKIFIYPENSQSGGLNLYEYDTVNNKCKFIKMLSDKPLTDAVLVDILGTEYLFATREPNSNSNVLEQYKDDSLIETYYFDSKIGRNAGDWFTYKGSLYRPAQDNNITYGGALLIQKININENKIKFETVRRIESQHPKLKKGCHTFNRYKGLTVIDVKGPRYPLVFSLVDMLLKIRG